MPYATFSSPVHAPLEILWDLLIDKIEHPNKYVPGVSNVKILSQENDLVLREMTIPTGTLKEQITYDETTKTVTFTLVEHPQFTGQVINKIHLPQSKQESLILEFTLDWQPINPDVSQDEPDMSATIQEAVLHTKQLAESQVKEPQ